MFLADEELIDLLLISLVENCEVVEVSLLLLGFFGEDVAVISMLPLDLACSGKRKAFFGTGISLELCHFFVC